MFFAINPEEEVRIALVFSQMKEKRGGINFWQEAFVDLFSELKSHEKSIKKVVKREYQKWDSAKDIQELEQEWIKYKPLFEPTFKKIFGFFDDSTWCYLSIFNAGPRFPKENYFLVYRGYGLTKKIECIIHELLHFHLYNFIKQNLPKLFQKYDINQEPLWSLSEIFNVFIEEKYFIPLTKVPVFYYPDHKDRIPLFRKLYFEDCQKDLNKFIKIALAKQDKPII